MSNQSGNPDNVEKSTKSASTEHYDRSLAVPLICLPLLKAIVCIIVNLHNILFKNKLINE
jgi:hypothetical protein